MNQLPELISIDDKWPTQEDIDEIGKIWVYQSPIRGEQVGMLFKMLLEHYNEPLDLIIWHFTGYASEKLTTLGYTESSAKAHNNRLRYPFWMPGYVLMEPAENNKRIMAGHNFPIVKGHVSREEYDKMVANIQTGT